MVDIRLSKSKVNDYLICPRMFYFKHCTGLGKTKRSSSPELERGTILHEIFEAYNTNPEKFEQYFNFVKDDTAYEKNLYGFFYLLKMYGLERAKYAELEIYNEEWNLKGIIDAIYEVTIDDWIPETDDDGDTFQVNYPYTEYWLIDYKSGKYHKNKNAEYMMELYIYEYIANQYLKENYKPYNTHHTIDRIGMFFTSEPDNSFVKKVNTTDRNRAIKKFNGVVEKIQADEFNNVGKMCKWCAFSSICDDYSDEVISKLDDHVLLAL